MNDFDSIFLTARELSAEGRRAFLEEACGGDAELRARLERMLHKTEQADAFFGDTLKPEGETSTEKGGTDGSPPIGEGEGSVIGRYKLLQKIGEGGMGTVFMAEQEEPVRRRVALKIIKLGMDTKQVVARFEAERQALALMDHPNIARVLDGGATESGRPYFVMELVHGVPITEFCDQNKLSLRARLDLFLPVCKAIQSAHQKGIIHRDIKPSNVMVSLDNGEPTPKVIDFGVAKATDQKLTEKTVFTQYGAMIGTPAYMSPEQAEMTSLDVDTRTDVYSLGVLLYELLTGTTPFPARRLLRLAFGQIQKVIAEEEPEKPSTRVKTPGGAERSILVQARGRDASTLAGEIRGDLDWIVLKCLEKDRRRRYDTPNELVADLQRHLTNEPVAARPPSLGYRLQKAWQRNKLILVTAGLVAGALVAGIVASTWQAVRAAAAEKLAKERLAETAIERDQKEQARQDAEAISKFLTDVFRSPDPTRDGRTVTVAETLDAAAKNLETDLARQPAQRAKLQAALGRTYNALGLDREAVPLLEQVRNYHRATSGPEHPNTLSAMHVLAVCYRDVGRRNDALTLREDVLALRRKVSGPETPDTLQAMDNLAVSYWDVGRRAEALELQEKSLTLRRELSGPKHPDTLSAMVNVATFLNDVGRSEEALKLREETLALRREVSGPEHRETLVAMHNLGLSYQSAGRQEEALKLREELVALRRKVLGPEHRDTLGAMSGLAISLRDAGRRDESLKLRDEVLALCRKVLRPEHPDILAAMGSLATSYRDAGRQDEALKLGEEVVALRRKVSGPEHPNTLGAMVNLAGSYEETGRLAEAIALLEQTLPIARRVLPPNHPALAAALQNMATFYEKSGRSDEAAALRAEFKSLREKK